MLAEHAREIERREARISWLEAEVARLGNIVTTQADRLFSQYAQTDEALPHISRLTSKWST